MTSALPRNGTFLSLLVTLGFLAPAQATTLDVNRNRTLLIGVLAHDRGFASDNHENGVDLNLELQFAPLDLPGSPRPHLGATLNFQGDTNMAYAGLGFRLWDAPQWFFDFHLSAALHDGPLHKDPVGCDQNSDCGYGVRIMPRAGFEIGYAINPVESVSLLYDHMSHKWIIEGENEGLEHIGVRYLRTY